MPVTKYIWDVTTDSYLMETDENDATTAVYTNEPGQFGPVISQRRGGDSHFFHHDGLGSVVDVTDAAEDPTDSYVYKGYGEIAATAGSTANPFRWVGSLGYYYDNDLLQYYVRARHYDPRSARWSSEDPIEDDANAYRYVLNAPLESVDPTGEGFMPQSPVTWPDVTLPWPEPDLTRPPWPDPELEKLFCSSYEFWFPIYCPCCTCKETEFGKSFNPMMMGVAVRLLNAPANVTIKFVEGPEGYSLACPATRAAEGGARGGNGRPRARTERHLFVFVTNKNTCEALAMLAHEAVHIGQFGRWLNGHPQNVTPRARLVMEGQAYGAQCNAYADQECITDRRRRRAWVAACRRRLIPASTEEENIAKIVKGCNELVGEQPGGWEPV